MVLIGGQGTGAGGGGGFFIVTGSPFASTTARDAWAASNVGELVPNQALAQVTGGDWFLYTGPATTDWIVATPIVQGPPGNDGTAAIPNVADNTLVKVVGGAFVGTDLSETDERFTSVKEIQLPGGGGAILSNLDISAQGLVIGVRDIPTQRMFLPVATELTADGTQRPVDQGLAAVASIFTQGDDSENVAQNSAQFQFSNANISPGTAVSYQITRRSGAADALNCNLIMRLNSHTDAVPVVNYKRDQRRGLGFDLIGENPVITLPAPAFFSAADIVYTTIVSDDGDNLDLLGGTLDLGDGTQQIPAGTIRGRVSTPKPLAYQSEVEAKEDSLENPADDGAALTSLKDGTRSWKLVTEVLEALTGDDRLDYNALKNTPTSMDAPAFTTFTIGTQGQTVDAPFTFSGSTPYTYALDNHENTQGFITILDQDNSAIQSNITPAASGTGFALIPAGSPITLQAGESHTFKVRVQSSLTGTPLVERSYTVTARSTDDFLYLLADDNNTASDVDTAAATAVAFQSGNQVVTIPTFTGNMYFKIAQRSSDPEITEVLIGGINQFGAFTKTDDAVTIGGQTFDVYVTNNLWIGSIWSGRQMTLVRSTT